MTATERTGSRSARTRARLVAAALDLFETNGYDRTGTAQIAAAAGVSEMTFFRHFGSKERVLLDDPYDPLIAAAVADQPLGRPPIVRAVDGLRAAWRAIPEPEDEVVRRRIAIVARTPSLRSAVAANNAATEDVIAAQLESDGCDPLPARVVAAAVLAAVTAALLEWSRREERLGPLVLAALDALEARGG